MRRPLAAALAGAVLLASPPALAWNNHGHMLIAAVAWRDLTPAARARVGGLLKLNPDYAAWTDGVPAREKARVAFMKAATWPDEIRHAPGYRNDTIADSGPDAARNIGYGDRLAHPYWHYRDDPFSPDGTPLHPPETPNASTQIEAFARTLGSRDADDDVKSYDLVWLEHLVGDVHQPLHAVSRFTRDAPQGDRGGNGVKVCEGDACQGELHYVWDAALGRSEDPADIEAEAKALPRAPERLARVSDDRAWLAESAAIARARVYAGPIGPGLGPYTLTPRYEARARRLARDRAALAGVRLARLIDAALVPSQRQAARNP